jgi:ADP-L-glycero-D-manno-heptose 6-epimerase
MIKICVTGNKGFIGKALQNRLESMGHIVVGIEKWIFEREIWQEKLYEYLDNLNSDVVFHVGACSDTQNQNLKEMFQLNTESTSIIADWCEFKSKPLIYSSSASVYGTTNSPDTAYAWSKFLGEKFVNKCGGVSLRYFNVFGNYEIPKGKMASIACQAYLKHIHGEDVYLFPQNPKRDFVYVEDVVDANIHAWQNFDSLKGGWYDVGSGEASSFEYVLETMNIPYKYADESEIPKNYQFFTHADVSKFMPNWKPKYSLKDAITEYLSLLKVTSPPIF